MCEKRDEKRTSSVSAEGEGFGETRRGAGDSARPEGGLSAQHTGCAGAKPAAKRSARRGAVILIRRGDPEISGAIAEGLLKGMGAPHPALRATISSRGRLEGDSARPEGGLSLQAQRSKTQAKPATERSDRRGANWLTGEQIEVVEAEIDRQKIVAGLLRVATRNTKTQEDYEMLMIKERCEIQRYERPAGPLRRLGRRALGLYGLLCYGISLAYRQQDRVLESR